MRICLVYDCLFPYTVGGAERWYRTLAGRLAADGHEVTYLTMRQWEADVTADLPGVRVAVAGPRMALYSGPGQRRVLPPLVFGAGVLWHLLRHGRRYDVVHTASFPYFSLLAAAVARRLHPFRLVVDWHELWTREYWLGYLGGAGGRVGWAVQRLCTRVQQHAFCFARVTAERLRGFGVEVTVLEGQYAGALTPAAAAPAKPIVVFAGRHIPEKNAPAAAAGIAAARRRVPELRGVIFGEGPDPPPATDGVDTPGFVDGEELERTLARALCLLHPSRREGYGQVVVQASAVGVPSIVLRHPDNAAADLVEEGVNGFVVDSAEPGALADAIVRVWEAGPPLRTSTTEWFARNAPRLSVDASLETVAAAYRDPS